MTRTRFRICNWLLGVIWFAASALPDVALAKGYSSGGHSYSSHSSSHSSSGGSRSYSSSSSSRSSGGSSGSSKSFSSSSGKSYSAGSSRDTGNSHGYSSGKSYGAGSGNTFSSKPPSRDGSKSVTDSSSKRSASDSGFSFDTAAARARKEETSKADYTRFKESKTPPIINSVDRGAANSPRAAPGSVGNYSRRRDLYVPDVTVIHTRPSRVYSVFYPYYYRPVVVYHDPYSSFFWWWLLDRSIDQQAWWAYHHRYDMDPGRYQALVASNQQLESRVAQLEAQQAPRDPTYTPTGLDRDLMYSDHYVAQAYSNRPTRSSAIAFWLFGLPLAVGFCAFFVWLIWFKRWQTAT